MTQPAVSTEVQVTLSTADARGTQLSVLAKVQPSSPNVWPKTSDGWVLLVPFAGAATGTAIREFGIYGLAASVAGGLLIAVGATLSPLPVTRAMRRSSQFSARSRLALPRGSDA